MMTMVSTLYSPTFYNPVSPNFYPRVISPPVQVERSMQDKLEQGVRQALQEAKMHSLATILMGGGSLVMNLIPIFRMPWKMAFLMAPFHMGWMALINLGLGFVRGFNTKQQSHAVNAPINRGS